MRATAPILALALVAWLSTSVSQLDPDETGIVLRFGRVVREVSSGVTLTLPWPLERLEKVTTSQVRTVSVGVPEDTDDPLLSPDTSLWLTGDTNILLMRLEVQYDVADPVSYLTRFAGEPRGGSDPIVRQATEAVVTKLIGSWKVDEALSIKRPELIARTSSEVQQQLHELETGLRILTINIDVLAPPNASGVAASFRAVETERQNKRKLLDKTLADAARGKTEKRTEASGIVTATQKWADRHIGAAQRVAERFESLVGQAENGTFRRRLADDATRAIFDRAQRRWVTPGQSRLHLELPPRANDSK
ncbi:MAG: protease modulator HflK [Planctomycetota bacterium]